MVALLKDTAKTIISCKDNTGVFMLVSHVDFYLFKILIKKKNCFIFFTLILKT